MTPPNPNHPPSYIIEFDMNNADPPVRLTGYHAEHVAFDPACSIRPCQVTFNDTLRSINLRGEISPVTRDRIAVIMPINVGMTINGEPKPPYVPYRFEPSTGTLSIYFPVTRMPVSQLVTMLNSLGTACKNLEFSLALREIYGDSQKYSNLRGDVNIEKIYISSNFVYSTPSAVDFLEAFPKAKVNYELRAEEVNIQQAFYNRSTATPVDHDLFSRFDRTVSSQKGQYNWWVPELQVPGRPFGSR